MAAIFPKLETIEDAKNAAKQGALAGLLFAGMYVLGIAFILWLGESPTDRSAADQSDVMGGAVVTTIILLFTWRVWTGKGFVSAALLLVAFLAEVAMKVVGGTASAGWFIFYFFVAAGLFNGLRRTLAYRRLSKSLATAIAAS